MAPPHPPIAELAELLAEGLTDQALEVARRWAPLRETTPEQLLQEASRWLKLCRRSDVEL
jgi:hypothetical protein